MNVIPDSPTAKLPLSTDAIRRLIDEAFRPANFFVDPRMKLEWSHLPAEEIAWEILQRRLLDASQTRERASFESWNIHQVGDAGRSDEPLLSVKLDLASGQIQVVRALYSYAWEGYHAGDNIYLSRETRKWLRELVGAIAVERCTSETAFRAELTRLLFLAVVGTSRLPLASVETPLPGFSFGELGYFYRALQAPVEAKSRPMHSTRELIAWSLHNGLDWQEKTKWFELVLRSIGRAEVPNTAAELIARWRDLGHSTDDLQNLLRSVFNDVALSPWTDFAERMLQFVEALQVLGALTISDRIDFLSYVLRNLGRHLTAYDLVTFHHRGANYPDGLLLDAVLRELLRLANENPSLFVSGTDPGVQSRLQRWRRRALRQGWLLHRFYEGLPIPDVPTSPGENARVLPVARVPEEQILMPGKRTRKLFEGGDNGVVLGDTVRSILAESIQDLRIPSEIRELGMATFLDRPLGAFKAPGEPDRTMLLSYEAFSRSIAARRLGLLAKEAARIALPMDLEEAEDALRRVEVRGISLPPFKRPTRPESVSLEDARKAADDFVFLRTTRRTAREFFAAFDFTSLAAEFALADVVSGQPVLIIDGMLTGGTPGTLQVYDSQLRPRLELALLPERGYESRVDKEYPRDGLAVVRVWTVGDVKETLCEHNLRDAGRLLPPNA
jgi:hypothetical protein